MSNSQSSFDGGRTGKAPERSNFVQTCNLLSQFIKGKVTLRDLNSIGIAGKSEVTTETATKDLLTIMEKPSIETNEKEQMSIDPIPQSATTKSAREMEVVVNEPSMSKEAPKEPKAAQLTMFYDGKVIVFDDFPADKARAVMLLASKGCQSTFGTFPTAEVNKINTSAATTAPMSCNRTDQLRPNTISIAPQQQQPLHVSCNKTDQLKPASISSAPLKQQKQNQLIQSNTAATSSSELPIARRSSLHRFLEKRKDRSTARAPYQVHNNPLPSSSNNGESSSKDCAYQLDLNFKL